MDERLRFVARLLEGEQMAPLCAEFGISRKTGYKIFDRYKDCGVAAYTDRRDKAAGGFDENDHRQDSRRGRVAGNGLGSGESANVRARLRASRGCARRENNDYLKTPAASRQQGHAESGSEAETEKTLEQEVPDGGADRQAHHREQGELSEFWLNHSATLHPWVGLGLRTDNYHDDRTIHRLGRRADRRRRDLDGWLVGVAEDGGLPPWIRC